MVEPSGGSGAAFSVRLRGYDRGEVGSALGRFAAELDQSNARVVELEAQLAELVDQRQELLVKVEGALGDQRELVDLLEHLRQRHADLRHRAEAAERELVRFRGLEDSLTSARARTEEEMVTTRAQARREADAIIDAATVHARRIEEHATLAREAILEDVRWVHARFQASVEALDDPRLAAG
jgi:cell division septum initiation protein DivIVA